LRRARGKSKCKRWGRCQGREKTPPLEDCYGGEKRPYLISARERGGVNWGALMSIGEEGLLVGEKPYVKGKKKRLALSNFCGRKKEEGGLGT